LDKVIFLLPYIISLGITLGVLAYTWRHRSVRGASAYVWYVVGQSLWTFGYIIELLSQQLSGKIFWDKFQYVAGLIILIAFPVFVIQYTETALRNQKLLFGLSLIVPISFTVLLLTDGQHHLLYPNPHLDFRYIFAELRYDFTWQVYAYAAYTYLISLIGLVLLIRRFIQPHRLYRSQILTIVFGFALPLIFTILTTTGVDFMPFRDVSPFTFAIGNLVVTWGLFHYHLFDIIPIARDLIVDNMEDLVVVLDMQDRIVDINPSALAAINQKESQVIGQPVETVLAKWPDLLEKFDVPENIKTEITIFADGRPFQYEVKSTLLYDKRERYIGRVFVSRDITEHTILQRQLQQINEELEERVAHRTSELAEAYDTTLEGWARALELRDKETEDHSRRVTELTVILAQTLGIEGEELSHIRRGAILHDIGKLTIPDEILRKRGPLTDSERKVIEQHPLRGYELLSPISFLEKALEIPYCHHEHWDGNGYPRGLKGEEIPLAARIFSVVDVWDAVQSDRPYNHAWSREKAIQHLKDESGKYFDPECVSVFLELVEQGEI
jgi:putative nucleotidyltransferase with HDIG domain/PAS domain S-box-containing protein